MGSRSMLLFAEPTFLEGAASVLDLGDTLTDFNMSESTQQADMIALRSDWYAIGDDMRSAYEELRQEVERSRR